MPDPQLMTLAPMPRLLSGLKDCVWLSEGPVVIARAPGRLDVMGGIADYSGSNVCQLPLVVAAGVAAQRRDDGRLVCVSAQEASASVVEASAILGREPAEVRVALKDDAAWALYPLGCVWWLAQYAAARDDDGEVLAKLRRGVTIVLDSDVPLGGGVSSSAAIEVATMSALCKLFDIQLEPLALAAACQAVENRIVGAPCGIMDQIASCMGIENTLLWIFCQAPQSPANQPEAPAARVIEALAIPPGFIFVGVHSGVRHEVKGDPYTDTRVAAFMGQKIISIWGPGDMTRGHLANLDAEMFDASRLNDLPASLRGQDFLDQYGGTHDRVTTVVPDRIYHVRAATTHHVLEPRRVRQFINTIEDMNNTANATNIETHAQRAGELMYESHRSYGECANLGHPMTDRLVAMVRELGPNASFFGAKITGGGGGGTVAIFMRNGAEQQAALEKLRAAYTQETGRPSILFDGSGPGAAELGTATINL